MQLAEVAEALRALGGFAGAVERREQDSDQDGDDADHDEQLDEGEGPATLRSAFPRSNRSTKFDVPAASTIRACTRPGKQDVSNRRLRPPAVAGYTAATSGWIEGCFPG